MTLALLYCYAVLIFLALLTFFAAVVGAVTIYLEEAKSPRMGYCLRFWLTAVFVRKGFELGVLTWCVLTPL